MAPQGFWRFIMWRVWCTTLFFIALLIAVFTATSVYYVVRINMIEKHLNAAQAFRDAKARNRGGAATAEADGVEGTGRAVAHPTPHTEADEEFVNFHRFMSHATPAGHSEVAGRLRIATGTDPYTETYKPLAVNVPLSRQAVRNPTLPESFPLWENVLQGRAQTKEEGEMDLAEADAHRLGETARVPVPARQRYVLHGLTAGQQYMLRLSYLGSPSVNFEMRLFQVRRADVEQHQQQPQHGVPQGWSTVPQDTELRVFAVSASNELRFDFEEEVWLDATDVGKAEGLLEEDFEDAASLDRYVPVVEVRPRALSIPIDATRVPVVRFNIALEPLTSSFLPQVAVPLITYTAFVVVFVGYLCIYTFVSTGIAGGRPHED